MKNLALLAVFTMASIDPSSIQDRSEHESKSKTIKDIFDSHKNINQS